VTDLATLLQMLDAPILLCILGVIWRLDRRLLLIEIHMQNGKL